jgi:preprotein translocase subunit SecD
MNRYPLWKYLVIAFALAIGIVYTVPNFFPEVPAVQVSSSKATVKIDNALLFAAEEALKASGIPYTGATLDPTGIKVRLPSIRNEAKGRVAGSLATTSSSR